MIMDRRKYITKIRSTLLKPRMSRVAVVVQLLILALGVPAVAQRYSDWSAPVNLGPTINTTGFDGCPSVTKDGLNLLFMSNIGSTAQNIYVAHRETPEDAWGEPMALTAINTPTFTEGCPMLTI